MFSIVLKLAFRIRILVVLAKWRCSIISVPTFSHESRLLNEQKQDSVVLVAWQSAVRIAPCFERLGLHRLPAWPGSKVNFSLRIASFVPRETSLHFPCSESGNVGGCALWVRFVAPLMSQFFFCFPARL